jgi:hypothetical protein
MFRLACRCAVARALICALLMCAAPGIARAATVLYDFSSPPDTSDPISGAFTYSTPGGPSVTFEGMQYDGDGGFIDHTNNFVGVVFGVGPVTITFSPPVEFVETYISNSSGDFDQRPVNSKLFSLSAKLGDASVFTYDRAAETAPGSGVAEGYFLVAPTNPVMIDSISLSNFETDLLDDLKVNLVPEPSSAVMLLGAAVAGVMGGRRRRRRRRNVR